MLKFNLHTKFRVPNPNRFRDIAADRYFSEIHENRLFLGQNRAKRGKFSKMKK